MSTEVRPTNGLPGFRISPRFYGDDPAATVLGALAGVNKPGLVVKEQDGWTSVWSGAPIVRAELLRNIARVAGAHLYSEAGDVVYANRNFLAVYSPTAGLRTIRLPRVAKVTDIRTGEVVSDRAAQFGLTMAANSARIFALEDAGLGHRTN